MFYNNCILFFIHKVNMVSSSIKAKKSKSPVCMVHSVDNSEEKVKCFGLCCC